jgi:hypothetical protein
MFKWIVSMDLKKVSEKKRIQLIITTAAIIFAFIHLIWPNIKVDVITISLIVIAIFPWLAPLFKSVELPGGLKIEFQELRLVEESAQKAGLIKAEALPDHKKHDYSFLAVADQDSNLAVTGLRIEIEKRIKKLAKVAKIVPKRRGIIHLLRRLGDVNILNSEERSVLADILVVLNKASHEEEYDYRIARWVIDNGPKILDSLNEKFDKIEKNNLNS